MKKCPYCNADITSDCLICPNCKKDILTRREEFIYSKLMDKIDSERERIEQRFLNELLFAKWVLLIIIVFAGVILTYFGFENIRSFHEDMTYLKSKCENITDDARNTYERYQKKIDEEFADLKEKSHLQMKAISWQLDDVKNKIDKKIDQQFKEDNITKIIEDKAKEHTKKAVGKIVNERVNLVMQDYNIIMLAMAFDRDAFEKLRILEKKGDLPIQRLAEITKANIINSLWASLLLPTFDSVLINDDTGEEIDLKTAGLNEIRDLLQHDEINARFLVARFFRVTCDTNIGNKNIKDKNLIPLLIERVNKEKNLKILNEINICLNRITKQNIHLEDLDEWKSWWKQYKETK